MLNNKLYDKMKWVAQYLLPGLATLYFGISGIWGLPYPEQIVGTLVALNVFLGALLGMSNMQWQNNAYITAQVDNTLVETNFVEPEDEEVFVRKVLSQQNYEQFKWITLIFLPAVGTLYLALSKLWGFPYGPEVVGTVAAFTAFMGVMLGVTKAKFIRQTPVMG